MPIYRVWQINVVYETSEADEEVVRQRLEALLEGSGFAVAAIERDREQEQDGDG